MNKILLSLLVSILFFACSNHGDKVSKDFMEVYYKEGISKEQAEKSLD